MGRRYGWSLNDEFGCFMSAAGIVLTFALIAYSTALFLVAHGHSALVATAQPSALTDKAMSPPPLALQRAVRPQSSGLVWLSPDYKPGDPRLVDLVAAGDVMMGSINTGRNPQIVPGVDAASLIGDDLAAIFRHANIAFANLEGPLYDGASPSGKD